MALSHIPRARYEVFTDSDGFARWRKLAANNEILATSEAYAPRHPETSRFDFEAACRGVNADLSASLEIAAAIVHDDAVNLQDFIKVAAPPG